MMLYKSAIFLLFLCILSVQSYMLVQVRKDQNKSNVDALIHKVVPPKKFKEIADTAQKQFKNFRQFTIKNEAYDNDNELDSIVFAIKTDEQNGGRRQDGGRHKQSDGQKNWTKNLKYLFKKFSSFFISPGKSKRPDDKKILQQYNINPEIVTFKKSGGKPSIMYEIDTNSILKSIQDTISSRQFRKYTENLVSKAAIVYRTVRDELYKI